MRFWNAPLDTFGVSHDMELFQLDSKNSTFIFYTPKTVLLSTAF